MSLSEEQKNAADEICTKLQEGCNYVMLVAQPQSGKTKTYMQVMLSMLITGLFTQIYIITGCRDVSLRSQTENDVKNFLNGYISDNNGKLNLSTLQLLLSACGQNIKIAYGQDIKKLGKLKLNKNTLIIHDESHFAQDHNNTTYKSFYRHAGIDALLSNGDYSNLNNNRISIISVSATPFSELICDINTNDNQKAKVKLLPAPGYRGVGYVLDKKQIHPSFPITENNKDKLKNRLKENYLTDPKYIIIRSNKKGTKILNSIAHELDISFEHYYGNNDVSQLFKNEKIAYENLSKKPSKTTIIHVAGKLRMGQVINNKQHIAMVFESCTSPNVDTVLQGLMGRVFGYHTINIDVFIPIKVLEHVNQYRDYMENSNDTIITTNTKLKAMNVQLKDESYCEHNTTYHTTKNGKTVYAIPPIKIPSTIGNLCNNTEYQKIKTLLQEHNLVSHLNAIQSEEVMKSLDDKNKRWKNGRDMNHSSYQKRNDMQKIMSSIRDGLPCKTVFTNMTEDGQYLELLYFHGTISKSYVDLGVRDGNMFIIGFTENTEKNDEEQMTSVLTAKDKCVFKSVSGDTTFPKEMNGMIHILTPDSKKDPSIMIDELSKLIKYTIPNHPTYNESFLKHISVSTTYDMQNVINSIEEDIKGLKFKLTKKKGRPSLLDTEFRFRYESITWEIII